MRLERIGMLITCIFGMYVGIAVSISLEVIITHKDFHVAQNWVVDWMYVVIIPILGCCMNRTNLGIWRDDAYSKRMARLRTMPIPLTSILKARMLQSFALLFGAGGLFFLTQYLVSPVLRLAASPLEWIGFSVLWLFYGMIANALLIYFEIGYSGKVYVMFMLIVMGAYMLIIPVLTWQGIYLFHETFNYVVTKGNWGAVIFPAGLAVAGALVIGFRMVKRRVSTRSLFL